MASGDAKLIVMTGVTRGLGRALAVAFGKLGHTVAGCGRSADLVQALGDALGAPHDIAVVDVSRDKAVDAWADRVLRAHGAPDLLINNAAWINPNAPVWEVSADEFDRVIDINVKGVANVLRHFVPSMIARGKGVVVNMSSGWGRSTSPEVGPYCASKWAVEGLTRALAQELPRGLAAVPLNPGIIDTDMLRSAFGNKASHYVGPDEWARSAVPFLLKLGPRDNGKPLTVPSP
jgi:NAD(P)-dependent dehydrogenase (short-subunit alcohol dehydrogenase family)